MKLSEQYLLKLLEKVETIAPKAEPPTIEGLMRLFGLSREDAIYVLYGDRAID